MSTATKTRALVLSLAALAPAACGEGQDGGSGAGGECVGAKCDIAEDGSDGEAESGDDSGGQTDDDAGGQAGDQFPEHLVEVCEQRRDEAFNPNRTAFSTDVLRWSCADVPGTPADERGQEYCEYFAMVQLPGAPAPELLGLIEVLADSTDDDPQQTQPTPSGLELSDDEIAALEADPYAEAGRCVFTSWNADVDACQGACNPEQEVYGISLTDTEVFRMKFEANTYNAAEELVADCMEYLPGEGDPDDPDDLYHDDFMRACELNSVINETEYRKSDNTVCASALRLAECGCYLTLRVDLPSGLSQKGKLGFPLGGWAGQDTLPAGCRYESVTAGSKQVVTCELTAVEVLDNASELKSYCAERYADDVVVHVPVPAAAVRCEPSPEQDTYASTCSEEPWNLQP